MEKLYCAEYIVKTEDGKTRLIILDDLPQKELDRIEELSPTGFERLPVLEELLKNEKYNFADDKDYDDGRRWDDLTAGVWLRVEDNAHDLHEDTEKIIPKRCEVCGCLCDDGSCEVGQDMDCNDMEADPDDLVSRVKQCGTIPYIGITIDDDGISIDMIRTGKEEIEHLGSAPHGDRKTLLALFTTLHGQHVEIGVISQGDDPDEN